MTTNLDRLFDLIDSKSLIVNDTGFTLSTGSTSDFYFDCKAITLDGEGLSLTADIFLTLIEKHFNTAIAVGGLTMGADFIASAVCMKGYEQSKAIRYGSIVRKEAKLHGTGNNIENKLANGTKIVVVDDVITSGASTIKACAEFKKAGYVIIGVIALIDRQQGGKQQIEKALDDIQVHSVFKRNDFPRITIQEQKQGYTQEAFA